MMLYFQSVGEAEAVFKALSTPMRLKIMEMIYKNDSLSMNDLAAALSIHNLHGIDKDLTDFRKSDCFSICVCYNEKKRHPMLTDFEV